MSSGHEVFTVEVHPRVEFKLEAVDNSLSDINYFKYHEVDSKTVAIKLAHSLEDLVDRVSQSSYLSIPNHDKELLILLVNYG